MRRAAGYNAPLTPYLRGAVPHPTATCSNPDFSDVVTASSSGNQPYWDVEICGMVEILAEIGMAIAAVGGQKSKQSPNALGIDGMKGRFAVAPGGGELRVLEEGHGRTERRWRDTQCRHHVIGRDAERTPAHQEPIELKAGRVGENPQSFDSKICLQLPFLPSVGVLVRVGDIKIEATRPRRRSHLCPCYFKSSPGGPDHPTC